jgi:hypothetical protein
MNFLIETKHEYTIHLVNSIYQLIYDGLQNIYEDAKKNAKNNDELKIFQIFLSSVPKWNPSIIDSEYQRIIRLNSLGNTIEDLLKAVIKSNIVVLTNSNIEYNEQLLKELNIQDDFKNFIHLVYIECARSFYNTPFLFSHRDSPIDIKRNQSEILKIIQECVKNAVRKMIPLQITIKTYLENKSNKIPKDMESESQQIKSLLRSERRRTEVTPSSPRQLHEIIGTVHSDEYKGGNSILKDNSKVFNFNNFSPQNSEKTLRDSILNLQTEDKTNNNVFINPQKSVVKPKQKSAFGMSESSVYYENVDKNNNLIEEYSNNKGNTFTGLKINEKNSLNIINENDEKSAEKQSGNPFKNFSHLNV